MKLWQRNLLLLVLVVVLAAVPLLFVHGAQWKGADDRGMAAIQQVNASYRPWFGYVFNPSALGIERYMFGLQALLGAAVTFGVIGWFVGRRRVFNGAASATETSSGDLKIAGAIAVAAVALFAVLFIPQPTSGELQDLLSALQGVCLGYFAFFAGYPLGRRSATPTGGAVTAR